MGIESWPQQNNTEKPSSEEDVNNSSDANEAEGQRKQYEKESLPDLRTSIEQNKKVILKKEELNDFDKEYLNTQGKPGLYYLKSQNFLIEEIRYIDSNGDIAEYRFDPSTVKTYIDKYSDAVGIISDHDRGEIWENFEKDLEDIGFTKCETTSFPLWSRTDDYIVDREKKLAEEKKKGFSL